MQTVLERLPDCARVAIVRLRSLGDCVLTTPALEILNQSRPDLQIAVVVEDRFAPVFEGNGAVSALLPPTIPALREWRPDLCLNLHGGSRSAALTTASTAAIRAGFAHYRIQLPYNVKIPRAQQILHVDRVVHTAEHLASAMFYLGAHPMDIPRARLFGVIRTAGKPYAVIHPFASQPDKTWPSGRFLEVANQLDMEAVFIGGPGDDLTTFRKHRTLSAAPLPEIKNLLANATLFVGNDSGPAHMAAASEIPVAVIFGSSNVDVWRPWKTTAEVLSSADIASIPTEHVTSAVAKLLRVHA